MTQLNLKLNRERFKKNKMFGRISFLDLDCNMNKSGSSTRVGVNITKIPQNFFCLPGRIFFFFPCIGIFLPGI